MFGNQKTNITWDNNWLKKKTDPVATQMEDLDFSNNEVTPPYPVSEIINLLPWNKIQFRK